MNKTVINIVGSNVSIIPMYRNGNTWKGQVKRIGTTNTIALKPGDTVYYSDVDIIASIDTISDPPVITLDKDDRSNFRYEHIVTHYRVFAIEKVITIGVVNPVHNNLADFAGLNIF